MQTAGRPAVESGMTTNSPRRTHWLVRYYRWQARLYLRILRAVWIIPAPVEASIQKRLARRPGGGS
ncbi:hypothetical protein GCM10028799_38660 [Kribbella italica]